MGQEFVWVSGQGDPPGRWDLRRLGWAMRGPDDPRAGYLPWLLDCDRQPCSFCQLPKPELAAAIGVDSSSERTKLLGLGFGDVMARDVRLGELRLRIERLIAHAHALPRFRTAGPLRLDLFHRDAQHGNRWLGLHPREFQLLWRLAEASGRGVGRATLLREVWRLEHIPETNSLEVHVSRLRAKLAVSRLAWLVETDPEGGYRLGRVPPHEPALDRPAIMDDDGDQAVPKEILVHAME